MGAIHTTIDGPADRSGPYLRQIQTQTLVITWLGVLVALLGLIAVIVSAKPNLAAMMTLTGAGIVMLGFLRCLQKT